jgi:hypothetical protein
VIKELTAQIEEYAARSPDEGSGVRTPRLHGFGQWINYVCAGYAPLPETIPHALLLAYCNGHKFHPAQATPIPIVLCQMSDLRDGAAQQQGGGRHAVDLAVPGLRQQRH